MQIKPTRFPDWRRLVPPFWFQNERTNRTWDAALSEALDVFGVSEITDHTCYVGPFFVWSNNWPYSYGNNYEADTGLPTVKTRLKLRRMINDAQRMAVEKRRNYATSSESERLATQLYFAAKAIVDRERP